MRSIPVCLAFLVGCALDDAFEAQVMVEVSGDVESDELERIEELPEDCRELKAKMPPPPPDPLEPVPPPAIQSIDDLGWILATRSTPLDRLSQATLDDFRDSLRFNERGLITYRYDGVKRELSEDEHGELLGLFGLRPRDVLDDYACTQRATCTQTVRSVCVIRNC